MRRRRVLLVSYFFPPVGGAGVQRAAKFAKYLPEFGWDVSVLTVSNPSVPLVDGSLPDDVPRETVVRKARTLEPSYALKNAVSAARGESPSGVRKLRGVLKSAVRRVANAVLQPDPQILWMPAAVRCGNRLLGELAHDAIVATAPPFSSFLVGRRLARKSGLPLVLDYRDEWDLSNAVWENKGGGKLSRFVQRGMQNAALRSAAAVVATTRSSAQAICRVCRRAGSEAPVTAIYNGYDADDFRWADAVEAVGDSGEGRDDGVYRLAYVGTLWNLTNAEPLVRGVGLLAARRPDLASRLELVFAGRRTGPQEALLDGVYSLPVRVVRKPYVDHAEALQVMREADGLCVLLSDLPKAERVVPAKLFECAAARRWILAVAPRGEVWDLLAGHPAAACRTPGDVEGIASSLQAELERHAQGRRHDFSGFDATEFERRSQAESLAELLNRCVSGRQRETEKNSKLGDAQGAETPVLEGMLQ